MGATLRSEITTLVTHVAVLIAREALETGLRVGRFRGPKDGVAQAQAFLPAIYVVSTWVRVCNVSAV